MKKLASSIIGIVIFSATLFSGTSAFAVTDCKDLPRAEISVGDPLYQRSQDLDGDGISCERKVTGGTSNGGSTGGSATNGNSQNPANGSGAGVYGPSSGQVDANGNPVKLDSNGNPIKVDANGNPITVDKDGNPVNAQPNLANTGLNPILIWSGIGLVALGLGLFYTYRKMRTATN